MRPLEKKTYKEGDPDRVSAKQSPAKVKLKKLFHAYLGDPISNAGLRDDDAWIAGIVLNFLPKLTDIYPQILGICCVGRAPYGRQDLPVRNHLARMFREK